MNLISFLSITLFSSPLIQACGKKEEEFLKLKEIATSLDSYYIPTRYPNGLDEDIAPVDYYDKEDADKCLRCATLILDTVKKYIES